MKPNEKQRDSYAAPECGLTVIMSEGIISASGSGVNPGNPFPGETEDNWT